MCRLVGISIVASFFFIFIVLCTTNRVEIFRFEMHVRVGYRDGKWWPKEGVVTRIRPLVSFQEFIMYTHTHIHTHQFLVCVCHQRDERIKNMGGIYLIHFFDRRREKGVGEGNIKKKKKRWWRRGAESLSLLASSWLVSSSYSKVGFTFNPPSLSSD